MADSAVRAVFRCAERSMNQWGQTRSICSVFVSIESDPIDSIFNEHLLILDPDVVHIGQRLGGSLEAVLYWVDQSSLNLRAYLEGVDGEDGGARSMEEGPVIPMAEFVFHGNSK